MDELEERAEIDRLVEEQHQDDKYYQSPEFPNTVPLDLVQERLGTQDGQIFFHDARERGSVLVAPASPHAAWHGTLGGYARQKCRCRPCKDAKSAYERKLRAERAA